MGKVLKVGITGGIGSGKTTVSNIFRALGIPVYDADSRAKWLMAHDEALKKDLISNFGDKTFTPSGALDRKYLAGTVFGDPGQLRLLNSLVHPAVGEDARKWHARLTGIPYSLKEAALLYESGSFRDLDYVIVVTAPAETRVQRVMRRDGVSRDAVEARMRNQWPEAEKAARADFLIQNDGKKRLIPQVLDIHRVLTRKWEDQKT